MAKNLFWVIFSIVCLGCLLLAVIFANIDFILRKAFYVREWLQSGTLTEMDFQRYIGINPDNGFIRTNIFTGKRYGSVCVFNFSIKACDKDVFLALFPAKEIAMTQQESDNIRKEIIEHAQKINMSIQSGYTEGFFFKTQVASGLLYAWLENTSRQELQVYCTYIEIY